nr:ATP-binding cassette domain-containing protein [Bacillus sp. TH23]
MCRYDNEELFCKKVSICEVRPLIKNNSLGTNFLDLKRGLKRLGINGTVSQATKQREVFDEVSYPFITQIENEEGIHFVTVFEKKKSSLIIGDSTKDKQQVMTIKKFIEIWQPYVLEIDLENSEIKCEIEQNTKEVSIWRILKLVKWQLVISFVLSIVIYLLGVVLANIYSLYFNFLIPQKLSALVLELMGVYLVINILNFVLSFTNNFMYNLMSKKIDKIIIEKYFKGLLAKPNMAIESYEVGELLTNLSNVLMIRQRFLTYLQMIPVNVITMGFSFYLLFKSESRLSGLVLVLIVTLLLVLYLSQGRYEKLSKSLVKTGQEFNTTVVNIFSNMSIIKQLSLETEFGNRGVDKLTDYIGTRTKMFNFDSMQNQLKIFILSSFNILLFSCGVYLIINNQLSTGVLLTFNALLSYVTNPILNLANLQSSLVQGKVAQAKLYNIIESRIKFFGDEVLEIPAEDIEVSFENVSFDYDSTAKIFRNLSIDIKGNNLAISGLNGVGKSTFGKLIARLYIPDNGSIKVNGQNLQDFSEESIRDNIIYVDGRESLFESDVLDNIKLGRDIEDKYIIETINELNADSAFQNIDFENVDGTQLSLGQMQIVKILRSTLIKKKIYIFDEITNGLDEDVKLSVINYLLNLEGLKIFITHDKEVTEKCLEEFIVKDNNIIKKAII